MLIGENLPNSYYGKENLESYFGDTQADHLYYCDSPIFLVPADIRETSKVHVSLNNVRTELPGNLP